MKKLVRIISFLLVLCIVLSVMPAVTVAKAAETDADLWIDPVNGNDANDGTTEQKAFKTINAAKKKAAELSANGDVVVVLKGGTYDATEAITFGEAESGKNGHAITYRAASGETVLISGGVQLDSWTLYDATNNVYMTDIPADAKLTRQFYVDGEPQPMAAMELSPDDWTFISSSGYKSSSFTSEDTHQYLMVDLGSEKLVSSVILYGAGASGSEAEYFPRNFTIQTSPDGSAWTTQVTEVDYAAPNALTGVEFVFDSTTARYVKIDATKLSGSGSAYYLAFAEVQVGYTSSTKSVNLGVVQHVDLEVPLVTASGLTLSKNDSYTVDISSSAKSVAAVSLAVGSNAVGDTGGIKIQATTDGTNWQTVYAKEDYTWQLSNTFPFNPVAATKIRITSAANITVSELKVCKPSNLTGSATASGTGASTLTDGSFDSSYQAPGNEIIVNLGSIQDVGGVRLYPTYNGKEPAGYLKTALIQVSTDGITYYDALELPAIQTPTGGAQLLVFPKGYKAQYVKLKPTLLSGGSLQLDELEIAPSKIGGVDPATDDPNADAGEADTVVYDKVALTAANIVDFGYYRSGDMNTVISHNQGNLGNVFDGNYNTAIMDNGQQYQWMPPYGSNMPVLLLDVSSNGEPVTVNTIELAVNENGYYAPCNFEIQVTTAADQDNWTTVYKGEEVYWKNGNIAKYKIPETDVYKVRLVCTTLTPGYELAREEWSGGRFTMLEIREFALYNVYDPTNPTAANLVSQGEGAAGTTIYDARSATASSNPGSTNANRALDGVIEPKSNIGFSVNNDKYNLSYLKHPEHAELHTLYNWYHRIQHFTGAAGNEIYMATGLGVSNESGTLKPSFVYNDYMFIDVPGEWYIDRYEGKIYYKAEGTMDGKTAYLPVTEQVIDMDYASNITFEGITFSHTTFTFPSENEYLDQQANAYYYNSAYVQVPGGIDMNGCVNVVFDGCEIANMGTAGIRIRSDGLCTSDGNKILNCVVRDISYNGISIGHVTAHHGYQAWMLVKNTTVQNNYVTRVGVDMFDSVGIFAGYTNGTVIDHNEVAYTPYSGISVGWGWEQEEKNNTAALTDVGDNKITNNYIHNVCKTNVDGGAIYTLGWNEGTEIAYNYIHDSGTTGTKTEIGIYLDQGTTYTSVHNNVIGGVAQAWLQIYMNSIHDNTVQNNYYESGLSTRGSYVNKGNTTKNNTAVSDLKANATTKAIIDAAGPTDTSIKEGYENGYSFRHDIDMTYVSLDEPRFSELVQGWYNVQVENQVGRTYYDYVNKVVTVAVPKGTDRSSLGLTFSTESNYSGSPASGTRQDFTKPVTYKITRTLSDSATWTVNVVEQIGDPVYDDPTTPPVIVDPIDPDVPLVDVNRLQYNVLPVPKVGYYDTNNVWHDYENSNGGAKMVDDHIESWGGSQVYESGTPSGKTPAIVFNMGSTPLSMAGLEIMTNHGTLFTVTAFDIQVQTAKDGAWETVYTVDSNPFVNCCTQSFMFDEVVNVYGLRIMINAFNGNNGTNFFFAVQEITPWIATKGIEGVQIPAQSAQVGVYNDGAARTLLADAADAAAIIDGEKRVGIVIGDGYDQAGYAYLSSALYGNGGTQTPAAVIVLEKAALLNRVEVYHPQDGRISTPTKISVEVLAKDGVWKRVGTYSSSDWVGPAVVEFNSIEASQVRVLVENIVRVEGQIAQWILPEIQIYGVDVPPEPDDPDPTDPTEPTAAPTEPTVAPTEPTIAPTEPTVAPTEPTTAPTEPAVAAPEITKQPAKSYVAAGKTAKFTVEATGTGLTYQWQSSPNGTTWKNCSSSTAKNATFTFTAKSSHSSNFYRCVITDSAGNEVTADAVRLYVLGVTTQPKTQKVAVGEKVKYAVKATGAGKTYQWQVSTDGESWKNCSSSSATSATFTFTSKISHSSNYYRCKLTDSKGNVVYTDTVRLYVLGVKTQPKTQKVAAGEKVKYTVSATGAGKTYQWQSSADGKNWKNCSSSSATKATFTFTAKTIHSSNYYRCVIKDNAGNTVYTEAVRLYVLGITTQPTAKTVTAGKTAKFTVEATGAGKTYQWQVSTDGGKTWTNCSSSSATKATFTFTAKDKHNGNLYRCVIKDNGGNKVATDKVKLTVK